MSDNVIFQSVTPATAPAATVVSTEEITTLNGGAVTAQQVQRVALALRTADGIAVDLPGDATNGLDADIIRIASGASADIGAVADAAVITDATGSLSGKLRGLVKWAFERMPASLGQKAMTASFPVVLASDQSAIPVTMGAVPTGGATAANQSIEITALATLVTQTDGIEGLLAGTITTKETRAATSAVTSVNDTASSTTLLAANANRLGFSVYNDSTVTLYLKYGATASLTSFTVPILASGYFEDPWQYTGIVDGIWASDAAGAARITELT